MMMKTMMTGVREVRGNEGNDVDWRGWRTVLTLHRSM